jgi:protein phosphatase/serine/threonine-protein phosphatase Stp1
MTARGLCQGWGATHAGTRRPSNQDAFLLRSEIGLWAVADGAGGHGGGEIASARVVDALRTLPVGLASGELLARTRDALEQANAALRAEARARGPGALLASTVVVLMVRGGHFACLWAGDSRCYLWRGGLLTRLTRDHSMVQELLDAGALTEERAARHPHANVVTRAVGADETLVLDKVTGQVQPGDLFLLASDGVCKDLGDAAIAATLIGGGEGQGLADSLIALAMSAGSTDNVTVVLVRCG